ncbi:MAG: DUF5060 domain-containing protein [Limnochordaceae bacterium]|nr:DUF5060 domain-containing protein [Limnochordaceae bacterium]
MERLPGVSLPSEFLALVWSFVTVVAISLVSIASYVQAAEALPPQITAVTPNRTSVPRYSLLQLQVELEAEYDNPFDPDQIDLQAVFTSPTGRVLRVPGFFMLPYTRESAPGEVEWLSYPGPGQWQIRFTPDEVGDWTFVVLLKTPQGEAQSSGGRFVVTPSDAPGFIRVNKENPRGFAFDNGQPFWGIGENMGWYGSRKSGDYDVWLNHLAENGGNLIRVWMASWGFGIEWDGPDGLGNYLFRQDRAYQLDLLFERAQELGIKIILVLNNHGQLSARVNPEWDRNPYNVRNGGPLSRPTDFFTDPKAKELFRRRLRYIVARWGYATNLFAWEFWNEVDLTDDYDAESVTAWHREMAGVLRTLDPFDHMITTSFSDYRQEPSIWMLPGIDFTMTHFYGQPPRGDPDPAKSVLQRDRDKRRFDKPTFTAEYGLDWSAPSAQDPDGTHLHDILWASTVSGAAASAMTWWWDNYVDPRNLYRHFRPVSEFVARIGAGSLAGEPFSARVSGVPSGRRIEAYGEKGPNGVTVLWVRDARATWAEMKQGYQPQPVSGLSVELSGLAAGRYAVLWWDTVEGKPVRETTAIVGATDQTLVLDIPDFQRDIAAAILPERQP